MFFDRQRHSRAEGHLLGYKKRSIGGRSSFPYDHFIRFRLSHKTTSQHLAMSPIGTSDLNRGPLSQSTSRATSGRTTSGGNSRPRDTGQLTNGWHTPPGSGHGTPSSHHGSGLGNSTLRHGSGRGTPNLQVPPSTPQANGSTGSGETERNPSPGTLTTLLHSAASTQNTQR